MSLYLNLKFTPSSELEPTGWSLTGAVGTRPMYLLMTLLCFGLTLPFERAEAEEGALFQKHTKTKEKDSWRSAPKAQDLLAAVSRRERTSSSVQPT